MVFKAEVLTEGPNTRFVVTTRTDAPLAVYDHYVDRGEPENWIKDLKNALQAERLSDRRFWANAFRLVLHAAAFWLLDTSAAGWRPPMPRPPTSSSTPCACASSRSSVHLLHCERHYHHPRHYIGLALDDKSSVACRSTWLAMARPLVCAVVAASIAVELVLHVGRRSRRGAPLAQPPRDGTALCPRCRSRRPSTRRVS